MLRLNRDFSQKLINYEERQLRKQTKPNPLKKQIGKLYAKSIVADRWSDIKMACYEAVINGDRNTLVTINLGIATDCYNGLIVEQLYDKITTEGLMIVRSEFIESDFYQDLVKVRFDLSW